MSVSIFDQYSKEVTEYPDVLHIPRNAKEICGSFVQKEYEKRSTVWVKLKESTEKFTLEFYLNVLHDLSYWQKQGNIVIWKSGVSKWGCMPITFLYVSPHNKKKVIRYFTFA